LHDTLEDTLTAPDELETKFGQRVLGIVLEVTDDKTLPKDVRKQLQIEHSAGLSKEAVLIKIPSSLFVRKMIYTGHILSMSPMSPLNS